MKQHKITLSFKGNRNYIQGPDLFNALLDYFPGKNLTNITHTMHKLIETSDGEIYISDRLSEFKMLVSTAHATASLSADGTSYWIAFIFNVENPNISARIAYDEQILAQLCKLDEKTITLTEESPHTFVETIVSMHKKLLQTLYPKAGKWLFTKLILTHYPAHATETTITLKHNFNYKLIKSLIKVDGQVLGEIYFSLLPE